MICITWFTTFIQPCEFCKHAVHSDVSYVCQEASLCTANHQYMPFILFFMADILVLPDRCYIQCQQSCVKPLSVRVFRDAQTFWDPDAILRIILTKHPTSWRSRIIMQVHTTTRTDHTTIRRSLTPRAVTAASWRIRSLRVDHLILGNDHANNFQHHVRDPSPLATTFMILQISFMTSDVCITSGAHECLLSLKYVWISRNGLAPAQCYLAVSHFVVLLVMPCVSWC